MVHPVVPDTGKWEEVASEFTFDLYAPLALEPSRVSVYLHTDNAVRMNATGGSGHFSTFSNSTEIAQITSSELPQEQHILLVKPAVEGVIQVTLRDRYFFVIRLWPRIIL